MAKRGRKKKIKLDLNISPETYRSVFAVVLFLFAILMLLSLFLPNYTLNRKINEFLTSNFGYSAIFAPILVGVTALMFVEAIQVRVKEIRVVMGLLFFSISFSSLLSFIKESLGRNFGDYLTSTFSKLLSVYGAFLTFAVLLFVSIILIFDLSLSVIFAFVKDHLKLKFTFRLPKSEKKPEPKIEVVSSFVPPAYVDRPSYDNGEKDVVEAEAPVVAEKITETKVEIIPSFSSPLDDTPATIPTAMVGTKVTPTLPYIDKVWQLPPLELLDEQDTTPPDAGDIQRNKQIIKETLKSFDIDVEVVDHKAGPTFTKYVLSYPQGIRVARVSTLQFDIAMALSSPTGSVRIEAPIPGQPYIGIEVPNKTRSTVNFRSLITSDAMKSQKSKLAVVLGKDVGGAVHVYDIAKMPHLLIAGATNSGKSVFIHNIVFSILFRASPAEVKFIFIDPKHVELKDYSDIPHLLAPIITDIDKAPSAFKWAVSEMVRRYKMLESAHVKNIGEYNEMSGFQAMPYILIIVDELADIMIADPNAVEKSIIRLAQMARGVGIHLILAAQRPSADVITGLIKANIPARVAFNVTSQVDSRVIIDQPGAEKLLSRGDMLFVPPDRPNPVRLQAAYVSSDEIKNVVSFLKSQGVTPDFAEGVIEDDEPTSGFNASGGDAHDPLYKDAMDIVISSQKASASLLQRRLSIGYARAARLIDLLEEGGVVGPAQGSKPRDVLLDHLPDDELTSGHKDIKSPSIESLNELR